MRDSDPWLLANLTVPVLLAKVLEKTDNLCGGLLYEQNLR